MLCFKFINCCPVKVIKVIICILWCRCSCCWLQSGTCVVGQYRWPLLLLLLARPGRVLVLLLLHLLLLLAMPHWLLLLLLLLLLHCVTEVLLEVILPHKGLEDTCCCAQL
jgi:hypothetical protein